MLVLTFFYLFLGANGLILGNDSAVHLKTAQYFLNEGKIPLSDVAWYTPMYHLILDTFIAFTGITNIDQLLGLVRAFTALVNWLLVFSVYIVASKFLGKRTGIFASAFILLCFPLFELNSWGGYTSLLSIAFLALMLMYLALPIRSVGNTLVAFVLAFSLVLSHQLATFLAVFILPPFIVVMLVKSRGNTSKALIAAVLGGGIAFLIYYIKPILPFINDLVSILFFQLETMLYQVPMVSFSAFMTNFGFVLLFAFAGLGLAFFELRKHNSLSFYLLLVLSFVVPLLLSQSYLFGLYLPYQRFIYFLLPPTAVLAAITMSSLIDVSRKAFQNKSAGLRRKFLKLAAVVIVSALIAVMVIRFETVSGKIGEDIGFYSSSDEAAYQVASWINKNSIDPALSVVVSQKPGHWFGEYTGRNILAETDPVVDWNVNSECVLDMSYEMAHSLSMIRVYEAKANISDEVYGQMNMVWTPITFFPVNEACFTYTDDNGVVHSYLLSDLQRTISMDAFHNPKTVVIEYYGNDFALTEILEMDNDTYPVTVTWQIAALTQDLTYPKLYLSEYFDPKLSFTEANIPGLLDWTNPQNNATKVENGTWAITTFSSDNLKENNFIDVYSKSNQTAFAIQFLNRPATGNVGALKNGNIDAVRWQYNFYKISKNFTVSVSYKTLTFSMTSYPILKDPHEINNLFSQKVPSSHVQVRNFASIIRDNFVGFIVYDVKRFDPEVLSSGWMQLVYSNDKYVLLKVKADHPYSYIFEGTN